MIIIQSKTKMTLSKIQNMLKTGEKSHKLYLSLIVIAIPILFMNVLTPEWLDDYLYKFSMNNPQHRIENFNDVFSSIKAHYFNQNGRVIAHFIIQTFTSLIGKTLFNICNTIVFMVFLLEILCYTRLTKQTFAIWLTVIMLMLLMPRFYETALWMTGSVNYLWSGAACVGMLILFQRLHEVIIRPRHLLPLCLVSFVLGSMHEGICLPLALSCIIMTLYSHKQIKNKNTLLPITLCFLLGSFFCAFSPATFGRSSIDGAFSITKYMVNATNLIKFKIFMITLTCLAGYRFCNKIAFQSFTKDNIVLLLTILFSAGIVIVSGFTSERTGFGLELYSLLLLARLISGGKINSANKEPMKTVLSYTGATVFSLMMIPTIYYSLKNHAEYINEIRQIKTGKHIIATNEVKMPSIINRLVCTPLTREADDYYNSFDPRSIDCQWMANAFGKEKLMFFPEAWLNDIKQHPHHYNNFNINNPFPFYAKRIDDPIVHHVAFQLQPTDFKKLPFYIRPIAPKIERYNTNQIDAAKWCVVSIDNANYIIIGRNRWVDQRVENIIIN